MVGEERRGEGTTVRDRRGAGRPGGSGGGSSSNSKNSSKKRSRGRRKGEVRHPSLDIVSSDGRELRGKRIILCIAGSVAAYKAIELARLLMRHGCSSVTCVATKAATRLIRPAYLKWATGNDVVTDLTGDMEHIRLADYGRSDIVVVYPATANTIGRLANGMDDAPVSTVLTVALGSKIPIVVCPAMHESMYENPAVLRNIGFLSKRRGVSFVGPQMTEGKAKAPEPEHVLDHVISRFGPPESPLRGARVLLTAGPTVEFVDPVRVISNVSSGRTGVLLGAELAAAGARVTMVYGSGVHEPPKGVKTTRVETGAEMRTAVRSALGGARFDVIVMAAAVSDYAPARRRRTKIKSGGRAGRAHDQAQARAQDHRHGKEDAEGRASGRVQGGGRRVQGGPDKVCARQHGGIGRGSRGCKRRRIRVQREARLEQRHSGVTVIRVRVRLAQKGGGGWIHQGGDRGGA